jgi:hypothetical protein
MADNPLWEICERVKANKVPRVVWIAFVGSLALLAFDSLMFVTIAFSSSSKIDPGIATLCGAVIGLSVIAWQAGVGFQNLIKSQENQARIEREGRLHRAELEQEAEARVIERRRTDLLAALRAEIVALFGALSMAAYHVRNLIMIEKALQRTGKPSQTKLIRLNSFEAPVFTANISNLGLLGANLGADVISVCSLANGKEVKFEHEQPMPHDMVLMIYQGNLRSLEKWQSDLHHVAMRILANENNTADPGTLIETQDKRYAEITIDGD